MLEPESFEKVLETLEDIRKKSEEGTPIIVEGKKDEYSLRDLGISGPIHRIPEKNKTVLNSLEALPPSDAAIIMTDFDRAGEDLAEFCKKHLKRLGVEALTEPRKILKRHVRKAVKDVEGLKSFIQSEKENHSRGSRESSQSPRNSR